MYDATGKSNSEVISELITMLDEGKLVTVTEMCCEKVKKRRVV